MPAPHRVRAGRRLLFAVLLAAACAGCASGRGGGGGGALPTLDSARRLRYLVVAPVEVEPNGGGPKGTADQLGYWVTQYMTQVGLQVADPQHGHDVEVRMKMGAHGATVLLYGSARMRVMADGKVVDEWSTGDHVEPAAGFARTLARELVEAMVHSTRLAAHADAATGHRAAVASAPTAAPPPPPPPPDTGAGRTQLVSTGPGPGAPPDITAARAHARQGAAFYDLQRFQEAYTEFEQAYLIEQDPALLYNMGQCQKKLGNAEEALHFYKTYLRRAPDGPSSIEAQKRIKEIEDALARGRK